jgi:superfamily II DNA/RNA helicase
MIKYGFPDAVWVEGRRLHRAVPNVTQTWINVSDTSRADALGAALGLGTEGFRPDVDCAKTMVFVNSAEACEAVAAELKRQGFKAEAFGAQCTNSERAERLRAFADGSVSVLACTDAAARGVDVPGVAHVVQAEFAGNAVEYLHRIGRTARLGAKGLVTNLVGEKDEELVRAVRDCENRGVAVEGAFSRKRSFRKKFKKYGETRTAPQNRR